jgi:hypothetical protein
MKGIIKLNQGLKIRLKLHNNSTAFTVFGVTIFTDKNTKIISKIIAGIKAQLIPHKIKAKIAIIGIINHIIIK